MSGMQFELTFSNPKVVTGESLERCPAPTASPVRVDCVRNPRARRYILRLQPDGTARLTIPQGGTLAAAKRFLQRNTAWLEQQVSRLRNQGSRARIWTNGSTFLFRGEEVRIEQSGDGEWIQFGSERIKASTNKTNLRPAIELHLRRLAARELPGRLLEYANVHGLTVRKVTVRNQRTRWGSCSPRGTISLNWRLIQTPPFVRDYICLHELMHLREMNHSRRFWRAVEDVCPGYRLAERWLKACPRLLQ